MYILKNVYDEILKSYSLPPPEQGGILGVKNGIVCEYCHDDSVGTTESAVYVPKVAVLNKKIDEWCTEKITFGGIIHSHLLGQSKLSAGDEKYIKRLFESLPQKIDLLYFPIIIPKTNDFISFVAERIENDVIIRTDETHIILRKGGVQHE